jgi:multicomponent Na+:H+ antiporter subunit B
VIGRYPSEIVRVTSVVLAPFILLFGLYIIAHGHYGPGGGFAGGVVLAVGVILLRLVAEPEWVEAVFPPSVGLAAGSAGMLLFVAIGVVPLLTGGAFLEYGAVPLDVDVIDLRYFGILIVEIAVGLAVFGTLLVIFDVISGERTEP